MPNKSRKPLFVLMLVGLALALAGCLPFPLGSPEKSKMDPKLAGYWTTEEEGNHLLLALYPYDEHTYVLNAVEFKKAGDELVPTSVQVYKAWLTRVKGATFITLEPLVQRLPTGTDEKKVYLVARLIPEGNALVVKAVNTDFEPLKNVKSADDVRDVVTNHLDEPTLYDETPKRYRHLDPEKDKEILEPMLKLVK